MNNNEEKTMEYRRNISKICGIVLIVFIFGIFIGTKLEKYSINSIQAYLLNSIGFATSPNATDPNATPPNATNPNATPPNATPPNATNGNINLTDNILYLENFSFKTNLVKPGDKIYLEIITKGASKNGGTLLFKNVDNDTTFNVKINSISNNPYIEIPNNISKGEYKINEIMLVGINSDNSTFSRRYSSTNSNADYILDFLNKSITVNVEEPKVEEPKKESEKPQKQQETIKTETNKQEVTSEKKNIKLSLEKISLNQKESDINEKVYIDYTTNMNISSMKLIFINENNNKMTVHAKSLNKNTYFEIPTETIIGTYSLYSVTISTKDSTIIYSSDGNLKNSEKFNFNVNIVINDIKQQELFVYNNEEITNEIITKLYSAKSNVTIKISAESNPIIDKEIFNVIKGTDKNLIITYNDNEMIFAGKNIKDSKSIDASVTTSIITKDSDLGNIIDDGILVEYTSNGDLPGKTKARIKITEEIKNKFNKETINVYYYNTEKNNFKEIALGIKATEDDYYEFDLEHNSKFVLVKNKLDNSLLDTVEERVVDFQKSNKTNLSVIGLTFIFVLIIGIIITVIIIIEKRKNNKKIENNDIK